MFVSRSMTRKVITVNPDTTIFEAQELMAANRIRHLPVVVADNMLVGIVTDRDLRSALPYRFFKEGISPAETESLKNLRVKDIMTQKVISIPPAFTIQDALMVIQNSRVGALPVVDDDGRLQGILSVRDLLRAFINVLGIGQPGTLLCILVEEKVGQLKRCRVPVPAHAERGPGEKETGGHGLRAAGSDEMVYRPAAGRGTALGKAEVLTAWTTLSNAP
jgi:acetoin utilization protein AcuB